MIQKDTFDYNLIPQDILNKNFSDWYINKYDKLPICLFCNFLGYKNKNDFITFGTIVKHPLIDEYEIYKDYIPIYLFQSSIEVMRRYLLYCKENLI